MKSEKELSFDKLKVKRLIAKFGEEFTFKRYTQNEFGEPTDTFRDTVVKVYGVFHEDVSHRVQEGQTGSVINKKNVPYILVAYDSLLDIKYKDIVFVGGKEYQVQTINDSNNYHVALDICLSEVLSSGQ